MSSTTTGQTLGTRRVPETVTIGRTLMVEALAHLRAADMILIALNDGGARMFFEDLEGALDEEAFGPWEPGEGDDAYETDPLNVEVAARGSEITAKLIDKLLALRAGEIGGTLAGGIASHSDGLRRSAEDYRSSAAQVRMLGSLLA
ncbi:MAG TPA: hypothetical protein VNI55_06595 [Gaiellaceae bacterium]|nr:hypothetical protein [Gaiellaceae bacterium]